MSLSKGYGSSSGDRNLGSWSNAFIVDPSNPITKRTRFLSDRGIRGQLNMLFTDILEEMITDRKITEAERAELLAKFQSPIANKSASIKRGPADR